MISVIVGLRYIVFALFITFSAIIASVAVWNLSFAQSSQPEFQSTIKIDSYLIFVGASGLIFTFTIVFVELAHRNAVTSCVWFDCVWSGLFFVVGLAAASSVTSASMRACSQDTTIQAFCASTRVLEAFTWLSTILLFCYFLLLFVFSLIRARSDSRIWQWNIHNLPLCENRKLSSSPSSPYSPRFGDKGPISIAAPRPQRPGTNLNVMYAYRSGLSPDYQIEHFQPPSHLNLPQVLPPIVSNDRPSLYPQYVQPFLAPPPGALLPPALPRSSTSTSQSPPPLGNWPRADVMSQPSSLKKPRMVTPEAPTDDSTVLRSLNLSRSRPSGPRTKANSDGTSRPPPLDLSKISVFNESSPR